MSYSESFRIINGEFSRVSNDTRLTGRNNNDLVIGPSGAGKTRGYVMPNILQKSESMVIADTKGDLFYRYAPYLCENGYRIVNVDFKNPAQSPFGYDPLRHIPYHRKPGSWDELAIRRISTALCFGKNEHDPFWDEYSRTFLEAFIGYVLERCERKDRNMDSVIRMTGFSLRDIDYMFERYLDECRQGFTSDRIRTYLTAGRRRECLPAASIFCALISPAYRQLNSDAFTGNGIRLISKISAAG